MNVSIIAGIIITIVTITKLLFFNHHDYYNRDYYNPHYRECASFLKCVQSVFLGVFI